MSDGSIDLRTDVPHPARMYNYFLGGKDNYAADREAAAWVEEDFPAVRIAARANRDFMERATRYLAAEQGVRQFLDVGTGIPAVPNLHQVAQEVAPEARVVYVDNDPLVLAHARALLVGVPGPRGRGHSTAYVQADVSDPAAILTAPELTSTLDLSQPVAVSLMALLHFVPGDVHEIVRTLMAPLAPGSYLALSHVTTDFDCGPDDPDGMGRAVDVYTSRGIAVTPRTRAEVGWFFEGLELLEPGVEVVHRWRNERVEDPPLRDKQVSLWGAIGCKV
ncbi:SAM-dependent methyltransferase [Nocardia macrotermitis]|uniref:S-adenosyl methyltransferase n=1 Tax=Nocardia macrotermitis TaxID=2585198 RepID=A0A7K0DB33_9NOCA|nr:SAM-dependent methyltransferase [Nocardia macrotermitis]MQY23005.1 hypothetical protein [Nocardia macrotermitis]